MPMMQRTRTNELIAIKSGGGGAGTADDDTEENEGGGKTLLDPSRICNRRLSARSDEGESEPCGKAEGCWEEKGAGWEAA